MHDEPFERLNMVPFIDIMLVLLTMVLMTSSFIVSGRLPVQLPKASATGAPPPRAPQTIEIDAAGAIHLQGVALDVVQLQHKLTGLDKATSFVIRADKRSALAHFIDVVDALKQQGFERVSVQTEVVKR